MFNFGRFSLLSVKRTFRIWDMKVRKKEYEFCLSFFAKKVFGKKFFIWIYKIIHFPNSTCQSVIFRSECWNFFEVDLLKFYFLKFTKKHCYLLVKWVCNFDRFFWGGNTSHSRKNRKSKFWYEKFFEMSSYTYESFQLFILHKF